MCELSYYVVIVFPFHQNVFILYVCIFTSKFATALNVSCCIKQSAVVPFYNNNNNNDMSVASVEAHNPEAPPPTRMTDLSPTHIWEFLLRDPRLGWIRPAQRQEPAETVFCLFVCFLTCKQEDPDVTRDGRMGGERRKKRGRNVH